ncbi:MAG: NADH-quinone oxidoreductase subunit C [bacterium]|nr:MAG: NADH-quinone oxidoreductase subunit C [bacterium]
MTIDWNRQNFPGDDRESHPAVQALRDRFGNDVLEVGTFRGEVWVVVAPERCREVLLFLRDEPSLSFNFLSDLTAVHWPRRADAPLEVVYQLYSIAGRMRFRVKTRIPDDSEVDSAVPVWASAEWLEREVYDMFGIRFAGHPDLRRILNPEGFVGYPLRKEFPVGGRVKW